MNATKYAELAFENRRQRRLRLSRMRFVNEERRGMGWIWVVGVAAAVAAIALH